jgi:4-hydroxybenzoyl-CoA thioesterase
VRKKEKTISRKTIQIEWGDCDPANIVYFPRYLEYFDGCTTALFKHLGLAKPDIIRKYGIIGIPIVDLQARFIAPSKFSDQVVVKSQVTGWRRSSFSVCHRLYNKGVLAVECFETRVWTGVSAAKPGKIEGRPIPPEVIRKFSANAIPARARAPRSRKRT